MLKRLRIKFVCINMGVVVVMLAVVFGLLLVSAQRSLAEGNAERMHAALDLALRDARRGSAGREELPVPEETPQRAFFQCILVELGPAGEVRSASGYRSGGEMGAADGYLGEMVAAALATGESEGVLKGFGVRFLLDRGALGTRLVFADLSAETDTMSNLVRSFLLVGAAALAAFLLISVLLARWAVRPVEAAWNEQRRFVSDASHELKTPLTVIMTNAELLTDPAYDAAARGRFAENILTMSRQMRGLVEGLLELARVENGTAARQMEELDFSALCAEALLPFEPLCFEKGLCLRSEIAEGLRVRGDAGLLRQVFDILLDNALKYASPGGEVAVRLSRAGGRCALSVADQGEPIPAGDLPKLFDRFYRADKARSRNGSYGLGLSIARKIVEGHRGGICAESAEGYNTFTVSLPTA